jgi:hypothetical protein
VHARAVSRERRHRDENRRTEDGNCFRRPRSVRSCNRLRAAARCPAPLSSRAHIILRSAEGETSNSIAERLKLTKAAVARGARDSSIHRAPHCRPVRRAPGQAAHDRRRTCRPDDEDNCAKHAGRRLELDALERARWLLRLALPRPTRSATSSSPACSRLALGVSSCPVTHASSRSCVTWWARPSVHRTAPWSSAWMRFLRAASALTARGALSLFRYKVDESGTRLALCLACKGAVLGCHWFDRR